MSSQFQPGQHLLFSETGETYEILAQDGVLVNTKNSQTGYRRNFTLVEIAYQNAKLTPSRKATVLSTKTEKSQFLQHGNQPIQSTPLIACVDDSKLVQFHVKNMLEKSSYRVLSILEPTAALTRLVHDKPSLILMDVNMPKLNGFQLCERLQHSEELKNIPIVMLTAEEGIINRLRAKWLGAVHYLKKPFEPQQLIEIINRLVQA